MSEGAAAAPAAAPAATSAPAPNASDSAPDKSDKTTAAPDAPKPWGEDDDRELFERLKRSPYKTKFRGEEKPIDSRDSMREFLNHSQRGLGASKLAEEAKAVRAEAEKHKAEVERTKSLIEAAKRGDFNARKELGLASPEELRQRQAEWEQVPEPVRQMAEEVERLRLENKRFVEEKTAAEKAAAERAEATEMLATKRQVVNFTHNVLTQLGLGKNEKVVERMLPQVAGAIGDLAEEGLEIGVDMTEELIAQRVKERLGGFDDDVFQAAPPKRLVAALAPQLATADDATLLESFGDEFAKRIALAYGRKIQRAKAQPAPVVAPQSPQGREESRRESPVLTPPWLRPR